MNSKYVLLLFNAYILILERLETVVYELGDWIARDWLENIEISKVRVLDRDTWLCRVTHTPIYPLHEKGN